MRSREVQESEGRRRGVMERLGRVCTTVRKTNPHLSQSVTVNRLVPRLRHNDHDAPRLGVVVVVVVVVVVDILRY